MKEKLGRIQAAFDKADRRTKRTILNYCLELLTAAGIEAVMNFTERIV